MATKQLAFIGCRRLGDDKEDTLLQKEGLC